VTFTITQRVTPRFVAVTAPRANLRHLPGTGCPIVGALHKGAVVILTGRSAHTKANGDWREIHLGAGVAWIGASLIHR
jgi:hypothetical protein